MEEKTVSVANTAKHIDKGSITEYTQRLQEAGYKDYSRTIDEKPSGTPGWIVKLALGQGQTSSSLFGGKFFFLKSLKSRRSLRI